jgi:hypothetical protein
MRRLAFALTLLAACTESSTGPGGAGGSGGSDTSAQATAGGSGGQDASVTIGSTSATFTSAEASTGSGGSGGQGGAGGEGGSGGRDTTTAATSTSSTGGDPGCAAVPCDYGNGFECDDACGNENGIVCVGKVCDPYESLTAGLAPTTIRTPPISGPASACAENCPDGDVWWMVRILVRAGDCVSAIGPAGSSVRLENPNTDALACETLAESCVDQTNQYGEDTYLALAIPAGMVTDAVVFTVSTGNTGECTPLDCAAAGCNGAGG